MAGRHCEVNSNSLKQFEVSACPDRKEDVAHRGVFLCNCTDECRHKPRTVTPLRSGHTFLLPWTLFDPESK